MKVRLTPRARLQLLDATSWIRRESPDAAASFRRRVQDAFRRIARFPDSGPSISEFPDLLFREVYVSPCRFFYQTRGEVVWVVAVWHGARMPDEPDPLAT